MKRLDPDIIDYYNGEVVRMMVDKYGYSFMDAFREFVFSKTHEMLEYYADYKNKKTADVLKEWDACGITQEIYDN